MTKVNDISCGIVIIEAFASSLHSRAPFVFAVHNPALKAVVQSFLVGLCLDGGRNISLREKVLLGVVSCFPRLVVFVLFRLPVDYVRFALDA